MTIVRELLTVLGFDLNETGFKRAEQGFQSLLGLSAEIVDRVSRLGGHFLNLALRAAAAGDEALAASLRTGIGVEEYQKLAYAAHQSNVSVGELEAGLRTAARQADLAARKGGEAAGAFARLGIRATDTNGRVRPTVDILLDAADALTRIENPTKRAALAQEIFGRSGQRLLPLMLEGRKGIEALLLRAEQLGFVLSEKDAKAGDALNDALYDLRLVTNSLALRLGTALVPAITAVTNALADLLIENQAVLDGGIDALAFVVDFIEWLGRLVRMVAENTRFFAFFAGVIALVVVPALTALAFILGVVEIEMLAIGFAVIAITGILLALAAVIALVAEDIYVFVTGGQSLLGSLVDAFLNQPADENDHWLVKVLRVVLRFIRRSIVAVDEFFTKFFETYERTGSLWATLWESAKDLGVDAINGWANALQRFFDQINIAAARGDIVAKILQGLTRSNSFGLALEGFSNVRGLLNEPTAEALPIHARDLGGGTPGGGLYIGDSNISIAQDFEGVPLEPGEVARQTADAVDQKLGERNRELARQVGGRGKR